MEQRQEELFFAMASLCGCEFVLSCWQGMSTSDSFHMCVYMSRDAASRSFAFLAFAYLMHTPHFQRAAHCFFLQFGLPEAQLSHARLWCVRILPFAHFDMWSSG